MANTRVSVFQVQSNTFWVSITNNLTIFQRFNLGIGSKEIFIQKTINISLTNTMLMDVSSNFFCISIHKLHPLGVFGFDETEFFTLIVTFISWVAIWKPSQALIEFKIFLESLAIFVLVANLLTCLKISQSVDFRQLLIPSTVINPYAMSFVLLVCCLCDQLYLSSRLFQHSFLNLDTSVSLIELVAFSTEKLYALSCHSKGKAGVTYDSVATTTIFFRCFIWWTILTPSILHQHLRPITYFCTTCSHTFHRFGKFRTWFTYAQWSYDMNSTVAFRHNTLSAYGIKTNSTLILNKSIFSSEF